MDFVNKGDKSISLQNLIMEAGHQLGLYAQWSGKMDWINHQVEYFHCANCLVKLAEVMVCGSVGGFDVVEVKGKRIFQNTDSGTRPVDRWEHAGLYDSLFGRWLWLFMFYTKNNGDKTELGGPGWYTVAQLRKFFARRKDKLI